MELLTNDITIDILVGFFYSAIFGIIIYYVTTKQQQREKLKKMEIDIVQYTFVSSMISYKLVKLSKLNGKDYGKFFANILDGKIVDNNKYDYIMFDSIPQLPGLNDYLISEFINKSYMIPNNIIELLSILKSSAQERDDFMKEINILLIQYNYFKNDINEINESLEYYRDITKVLISSDVINSELQKDKSKREFIAFTYLIELIRAKSEKMLTDLKELDNCILDNKDKLKQELQTISKDYSWIIRTLWIALSICLVLLIIA